MRRNLHRAAIVACIAAFAVQALHAQLGPAFLKRDGESVQRASRWAAAVVRHQPGVHDGDIDEIARWTVPQVEDDLLVEAFVIHALMRNAQQRAFRTPDTITRTQTDLSYSKSDLDTLRDAAADAKRAGLDERDLIARGVLLHTDIALLASVDGVILHFNDGRPAGVNRQADHWRLARRLAAWLDTRSGRLPDVRFWYRATLATMAKANRWNTPHAETAAALRPADPELLFQAGCVHEMLASSRVQSSLAAADIPVAMVRHVRSAGEELRMAAPLLKQATELDRRHVDAYIHYGRVLMLMDRPTDAITVLQHANAEAKTLEQQYYARLFLGGALYALERNEDARSAYEAAANVFPEAQSPQFGLSQLAERRGDRAMAARAMLGTLSTSPVSDADRDPWWRYSESCGADAIALLAEARSRLAAKRGMSQRTEERGL